MEYSLSELNALIAEKRIELQSLLQDNDIFHWPTEENMYQWASNDIRLTSNLKKRVISITSEILHLKKLRKKAFIKR